MRLDTGQHMRMEQRMKLSPRMIQSMEILQLPALALEERIEQELVENPTLELLENRADRADVDSIQQERADDDALRGEMKVGKNGTTDSADDFQRLDSLSSQYGDTWDYNTTGSSSFRGRQTGERDAKMDAMANTASRGRSLGEQLMDQWRFVEIEDPLVKQAGELVIGFIDDDGYLRTEMIHMIQQAPHGMRQDHLNQAIEIIQTQLEPPGIGARNLAECLRLQLEADDGVDGEADSLNGLAREIVMHHLKDVEMNRLPRIARQTGQPIEQIKQALARLKRLDPFPGRQLAPVQTEVIVPDVQVEYDPSQDRYVAGLNRGRTPALRVSPIYSKMYKQTKGDKQTREFLSGNLHNARWLIDAIDQRNNTLMRVVNIVIDRQREFLDHGESYLRPLPMIQVADQLGIHVGTVSRAVSEKYIQTPRGIFPLRMFFTGGTESADGEEMSWTAVQAKLKDVVDREDPKKPWSDEALVKQLKADGIDIARRTVAKYRQQLGIPPARRRKQF